MNSTLNAKAYTNDGDKHLKYLGGISCIFSAMETVSDRVGPITVAQILHNLVQYKITIG